MSGTAKPEKTFKVMVSDAIMKCVRADISAENRVTEKRGSTAVMSNKMAVPQNWKDFSEICALLVFDVTVVDRLEF